MSAKLELRAESVGYGSDAVVLKDVSLSMDGGEIIAVLGVNGCGKSTLLRSIVGLAVLRNGLLRLDGVDQKKLTPEALAGAGVRMILQGGRIFKELNVAEHVRLARGGRAGTPAPLRDLLARTAPLMQRRADVLSGGEKQIVAVVCALLCEPRVLLADEPTLALADEVADEVLGAIQTMSRTNGMAVLIAEQHVKAAIRVSTRALLLRDGHIGKDQTLSTDNHRVELLIDLRESNSQDDPHATRTGGEAPRLARQ